MNNREFEEYLSRFPHRLHYALTVSEEAKNEFINASEVDFCGINVYRGTINNKEVSENDFISFPDAKNLSDEEIKERLIRDKKFNIGSFAVSVNESIDELITVLNIPYKRIKGIAKGQMTSEFGVADFKEGSTHHNWYLFEESEKKLSKQFSILSVEEIENERMVSGR